MDIYTLIRDITVTDEPYATVEIAILDEKGNTIETLPIDSIETFGLRTVQLYATTTRETGE